MKMWGPLAHKYWRISRWWQQHQTKCRALLSMGPWATEATPVCNVCCFKLLFIRRSLNTFDFASVFSNGYFYLNLLDFAQHSQYVYNNQIRLCALIIVPFHHLFCWFWRVTWDSLVGPAAFELMLGTQSPSRSCCRFKWHSGVIFPKGDLGRSRLSDSGKYTIEIPHVICMTQWVAQRKHSIKSDRYYLFAWLQLITKVLS